MPPIAMPQPGPPTPPGEALHDERFEPTGDEHVDRALMGLPHPEELRSSQTPADVSDEAPAGSHNTAATDGGTAGTSDAADRADAADKADLDSQVADVTAVHRQLQQRLSDLAG